MKLLTITLQVTALLLSAAALAKAAPTVVKEQSLKNVFGDGREAVVRILDRGEAWNEVQIEQDGKVQSFPNLLFGETFYLDHPMGKLGVANELHSEIGEIYDGTFGVGQSGTFTTWDNTYRGEFSRGLALKGESGKIFVQGFSANVPPTEKSLGETMDIRLDKQAGIARTLHWRGGKDDGKERRWVIPAGCRVELATYAASGLPACAKWETKHPAAKWQEQLAKSKLVKVKYIDDVNCDVHACGATTFVRDSVLSQARETCAKLFGADYADFVVYADNFEAVYDAGDYVRAVKVDFQYRCLPSVKP